MNSQPKVSIAIAIYNGQKYLREQMDSLLNQDYPNFEIVASDDCSTDDSWAILQEYEKRDSRIRLLPRETNRGYVGNFHRVFTESAGELISPCDQDDIWHPSKTRKLVECIKNADLAYCNSRFCNQDGTPTGKTVADTVSIGSSNDPRQFIFCTCVSGHAMIFKKNLLDTAKNINNASYIDWYIAYLAANRNGITYLDQVLVDWRQHSSSLTFTYRKNESGAKAKALKNDYQTICALAEIGGKHQDFARNAKLTFEKWLASYMHLGMFFFVLRNGHITHKLHPARFPSLKYLVGYKLKKIFRPKYY